MSDLITASTVIDLPTMLSAYRWHGRRRRWQDWMVWPAAMVLVFFAVYVRSSARGEPMNVKVLLLACAMVFAFSVAMSFVSLSLKRRRIERAIKLMPAYEKEIQWALGDSGLEVSTPGAQSTVGWSMIFESVATPQGSLIYTQKDLFLWLPKTAFASDADRQRFLELLKAKTKHSTVG
jgi:hypothetical protein